MRININQLNCDGCPAITLLDFDRIEENERLRETILDSTTNVNIILLGESTPANRFIYNLQSKYHTSGLRYNLRNELVNGSSDTELMRYLYKNGIVILDTALCPLHKLKTNKEKRDAATLCLDRHTRAYLEEFDDIPIITFFPRNRGFKKRMLPEIQNRIIDSFSFANLNGLKDRIDSLL